MLIRDATCQDAADICAIWNPIIRDSLITFTTRAKRPEEIARDITQAHDDGRAYLLAWDKSRLLGFATYAPFRPGPGYAQTMEHSINLGPEARGRGVGRALMASLETTARQNGVHSLVAGVSGANPAAIAFHKACGFAHVATLPEVGFKFDQWLDLVLLQKLL